MKFSAALIVAAAAIASAAPSFEPKAPVTKAPSCPAEYPEYSACPEDVKVACYPSGEPAKPYDDCTPEEQTTYYPHGPPKGHGGKGHGGKKDDDKHGGCKPDAYKKYEDCDAETAKVCYPKGRPTKPYEECAEDEKKDYYPHGPPKAPTYITTSVVKVYTTYCPEDTSVVYGTKTYTGHKDEYMTVDCPEYGCTVDMPYYATSVADPAYTTEAYPAETSAYAPGESYAAPEESYAAPEETYADAAPTYQVAGAAKAGSAGLAAVVGLAALVL